MLIASSPHHVTVNNVAQVLFVIAAFFAGIVFISRALRNVFDWLYLVLFLLAVGLAFHA